MSKIDRLRTMDHAAHREENCKTAKWAADEIWCLREIVRDVRIMANAGNFKKHEGEPWLLRVQNIDLES